MLKSGAERVLASRAAAFLSAPRRRAHRLVLAYHGIVPDGAPAAGERSLFVTARDFAAQLDALVEVADVVALDELDAPDGDRPRVAITFDDAYVGAVTAGVDVLARRELPAAIFVAPGRLGGQRFWWDSLAHAHGSIPASTRSHALDALRGLDEPIRSWMAHAGIPAAEELPPYALSAAVAELRAALAHPGIVLGSHSWTHANLTRSTPAELEAEMTRPLEWLRAEFGARAVPWIAYPYGLHDARVERAAREAGYRGGLAITGGWHRVGERAPFGRPRMNIPGQLSHAGFRARLLGTIAA